MNSDDSLRKERVYAESTDPVTAFVGTASGVVRVSASENIVGEFSMEWAGEVTDVAATDDTLVIGTTEDVLIRTDDTFEPTGFGPASAVGHDGSGRPIAAGNGRLATHADGWTTLTEIDAVRAIAPGMIAAESGIHRHDGTYVGLEDATDVSTTGQPIAATESGLYYLANGWTRALEGAFSTVESNGAEHYAATDASVYAASGDDEWTETDLPVEKPIVDIVHAGGVYAVTTDGTFLVNAGDGWRYRSLGVPGVTGVAVR